VFPKGLRLGTAGREITRQEKEHQDVIRTFRVRPFQELNTVEEVFVLVKTDSWVLSAAAADTLPSPDSTRSSATRPPQSKTPKKP
jgi:hypothetical protein